MLISIYLLGFFITYALLKYNMAKDPYNEWSAICFRLLFSLFSWITLLLFILLSIVFLLELCLNKIVDKLVKYKIKPPKFL